jgi:hypothetical protein
MYSEAYNDNGTQILIQAPANGSDAQLWNIKKLSTTSYAAINKADGLAATCNGNAMVQLQSFSNLPNQVFGAISLPNSATSGITERTTLVYFSTVDEPHDFPGSMDSLANPANANRWTYVRANAAGYCQSFLTMNAANIKGNVSTMQKVLQYFTNKNCYYSADTQNPLQGTTYPNNDSTDRVWLQQIINNGFNVNSTDIFNATPGNSISPVNTLNTLRTYPGSLRSCRVGGGPWTFGGDITKNVNDNANLRTMIANTDGMTLDGPMGFWINDDQQIQEGAVSAATYVHDAGKKIGIVLAPSGYFASSTTYSTAQYLAVAKTCVQYIEDHGQWLDEWDVYPYQSQGLAIFPESHIVDGQVAPAPTQTGVAYYLLKHLNDLPELGVSTGTVPANVTVTPSATSTSVIINTSQGSNLSYFLPISFTNGNDPQVDIAPLIAAVITGGTSDWKVTFTTSIGSNYDITNLVLGGGFSSVGFWRLTNTNNYTLSVNLTALKTNAQPISINLVIAANYSNTGNKTSYGISAKTQ